VRRRAPLSLLAAAAAVVAAALAGPPSPAHAASHKAAEGTPVVEVFAAGGGFVPENGDLEVSVVVANPSTRLVTAGDVNVAVSTSALASPKALADFQQNPGGVPARSLGTATTNTVPAGSTELVAQLTIPAASVGLPNTAPGVFGLTASMTTSEGALGTGTSTLIVPGTPSAPVGVAAIMPITVPTGTTGLVSTDELATYTGADGVLTRELSIAQHNPALTLGIDPQLLVSIRALGQSAPASAQAWLASLAKVSNPTFPLQYADADPVLQSQAGLAKPLAPTDFAYAMSAGDHDTPLTVGEPTSGTPTPTRTRTPTPTPSPSANTQLPSLSELTGFPYTLSGIAWPAPGMVRGADLATLKAAGFTSTIVSGGNTNAAALGGTPGPALHTAQGTALVTDDALSAALQDAATASDPTSATIATAALNAQLALAAENPPSGGVVVASLGRVLPTDAARASTAVSTALSSLFSRPATIQAALASAPTPGLALVDHQYAPERLQLAGSLLDLAGEPRSGGAMPGTNIANFSSVLVTPTLLTGEVRAHLLDLFAVGWASSDEWAAAAGKQLTRMQHTLSGVQIVSPGSIRQASRQALIPLTVMNRLAYPVSVVLRATPSSARLKIDSDTVKTIAPGSSAKVLVPVKAQLSNGTVHLALQLYTQSNVPVGAARNVEIDVHADWEGIGALIFGLIVVGFFGFGLLRTVQRRRREKGAGAAGAAEAASLSSDKGEPRG
jgi:hypothetical protein